MTADLELSLRFAHRANIERYRRLLTTRLDDHERQFVERRLAEEEQALRQMTHGRASVGAPLD